MLIGERAWELLHQLHYGPRSGDDPDGDRQRIRLLGELAEPAVLPALLALARDPQLTDAVATATGVLLKGLPALELAGLDQHMRCWPKLGGQILLKWDQLTPGELPGLTAGPGGAWLAAALCSHRNGRVRQAAVLLLDSAMTSGQEVPFLLLRLNDWVEPVRHSAARALQTRIHDENRDFFLDHLPLLERIPGRQDQQPLLQNLVAFCCRRDMLEAALSSRDPARRACAFRMAPGHIEAEGLLRRGLNDPEQAIQSWATRELGRSQVSQEFLQPLLTHPNPAVRLAALQQMESIPSEKMLLDPSSRVREATRRRLNGIDFRTFYRAHLDRKAGVAGLGEVGDRSDARLIIPLSQHASLARAAVKAVGQLDAETHCNFLAAFLSHPQPGLAREAFLAVRKLAPRLLGLCQRLARAGPPHSRRLALTLMEGASKWDSLRLMVELRHDPEVAERAERLLLRWLQRYNRRQTPPTPAQLQELRQLPELPLELQAILKAFP